MKTTIKILAVFALALSLLLPGPASTTYAQQNVPLQFPAEMLEQVRYLGGISMMLRADALGMKTIEGKNISQSGLSSNKQRKGRNVPVSVDPAFHENEPTVAVNPGNSKKLVAGSHFLPAAGCAAYSSSNGGTTWTSPFLMPLLTDFSFCSDPVLAYAPDGGRVYYAYMDIKSTVEETPTTITFNDDWDIVVSFSDNNGKTWTGPIVALDGDPSSFTFDTITGELLDFEPGFMYDKPWISTPQDSSQKNWAYVTATRFDNFGAFDCHITFTRSGDKSATWAAPALLESSGGCDPVVQGSRPSGGENGNVLVAWYNSGSDGFLAGGFEIRTRWSGNNGKIWGKIVTAASDSYELPFWLGPENFYHRWWGSMFPDVEIDGEGAAHIAYTHDPAANPEPGFSDTAEDGNIRYITSSGRQYKKWSAPVTVNDDGLVRAQGWATLETQNDHNKTTVLLMWEDHRLSPEVPTEFPNSSNLYYDIFSAQKKGSNWSPNRRVSDASSISDFIFIGDYFDLTATGEFVFGIWTDRRDKTDIFDFEDDVFGSWKLKKEDD